MWDRFSNSICKSFYGVFPESAECGPKLAANDFTRINNERLLSDIITDKKPHVVVALCGMGTPEGFVVNSLGSSRELLHSRWWDVSRGRVYAFAYSCHSYDFLRLPELSSRLSGAVGYKGEIWLDLHADGIDLWLSVVDRLRSVFARRGLVDGDGHEACIAVYSKLIRPPLLSRLFGRPSARSWHQRLFAVQQREQLKYFPGGRV